MAEPGWYLYCIIPCQEDRVFDAVAIGSGDSPVRTVCHRGLAAVISDSPVKQYESTRQHMMSHERVLETVMREFTLLPVRFGTIGDSADPVRDIQKLLSARFEEFHGLLTEMEDKVELGLKAFWRNEKAVFEELVAENPPVRKLRDSLSGKSLDSTHFDRIRLGELVKETLSRKKAKEAARILLPLRRVSHSVRENKVLSDRMIVNAAFLVDKNRETEFDQAVTRLDEQLGGRIALKYVGPVPPYNFVDIVVNWEELR